MSSHGASDGATALQVAFITKEWPPHIYGGAGVHVFQLTQALRKFPNIDVAVHCFGGPRVDAHANSLALASKV